jgi:dihydrodipicolinate synthase/N-acetylneuraminate lyase
MAPLTTAQILGNWATLLLPLNRDDSIDYGALTAELDAFAAAGVNGVYSNGSAGEFHTQTDAEFDQISELLAGRCTKAGVAFQIGACHPIAQITRERIRRTRSLGPGAFQVILPDWFPPTFAEIERFLADLAEDAAPVPLVVYNPPHAKRRLTPAEWGVLLDRVAGIVGMKVSGGDSSWYEAMQPVLARSSVFIPGHLLAEGLARGARGAYSNVACLSPRGAQQWYELCQRDLTAGRALGQRVLQFWNEQIAPLVTERKLPNMAADKAAAAAGGWLEGFSPRLRWPYESADAATVAKISVAARRALPEFFA